MPKISLFLSILLLLGACAPTQPAIDLAVTDVDVFDSVSKQVLRDRTLLIDDGVILEIVEGGDPPVADEVIDGRGRLVVPGFVDTHAHLLLIEGDGGFGPPQLAPAVREYIARQFLPFGTTTVADMGQPEGWLPEMVRWAADAGPDAPNLVVVGGSINSGERQGPMHHKYLASPQAARDKVREYHRLGVERLKLYRMLEEPELTAVIDESRALGMELYAHVDNNVVTIAQAMDLGVRHFEHFFTLIASTLDLEATAADFRQRFDLQPIRSLDEYTAQLSFYFAYIEQSPEHRAKLLALLDRMAEQGASISTTLAIMAAAAGQTDAYFAFEPQPGVQSAQLAYDDDQRQRLAAAFEATMAWVRRAHEKGIPLRIGSDSRNGGEALLAELVLLTKAGIPVADVLQIATLQGARALGLDQRLGVIAPGRAADLVLFAQSPFDEPQNFFSEKVVIKDGRIYEAKRSTANELATVAAREGASGAETWLTAHEGREGWGPLQRQELTDQLYLALADRRFATAEVLASLMEQRFPASDEIHHRAHESRLNNLGYRFLGGGETAPAIRVFEINRDLFPDSWNVYDSLGEAQLLAGDREGARTNYRKSLDLNPDNDNGSQVLAELAGPGDG